MRLLELCYFGASCSPAFNFMDYLRHYLPFLSVKWLCLILLLIVLAFFTSAFPLEEKYQSVSSVFVILFALPCYYGLVKSVGRKQSVVLIAVMSIFALILENVAITTGIPYGQFEYGQLIGATIGKVPWTVGFAWTPILFGAVAIIQNRFSQTSWWKQIILIGVVMTLFDLVLDPGSVALSFWTWHQPWGFYSVPWSNFGGWMVTSSIGAAIMLVVLKLWKSDQIVWSAWTYRSFILMLIYWTAICFFFQLWGAVMIGLVVLVGMKKKAKY